MRLAYYLRALVRTHTIRWNALCVSYKQALRPTTDSTSVTPLGGPLLSGFARKPRWVDPRTPRVAATNIWKARQTRTEQTRDVSIQARRSRTFARAWVLNLQGHKSRRLVLQQTTKLTSTIRKTKAADLQPQRTQKPVQKRWINEREADARTHQCSKVANKHSNQDAPEAPATSGPIWAIGVVRPGRPQTWHTTADELIDPEIPLPATSRQQKAGRAVNESKTGGPLAYLRGTERAECSTERASDLKGCVSIVRDKDGRERTIPLTMP